MIKTKITTNDGTKKKYESDAVFGAAVTEEGNGDTLVELFISGNMDALEACHAAIDLIREIDKTLDAHGMFTNTLILRLIAGDYEPEDVD